MVKIAKFRRGQQVSFNFKGESKHGEVVDNTTRNTKNPRWGIKVPFNRFTQAGKIYDVDEKDIKKK